MSSEPALQRLTLEHNYEFAIVPKEPSLIVQQDEPFVLELESGVNQPKRAVPEVGGSIYGENPAAGPIHVEGAQAGDLLVVTIHDIVVADTGFTLIVPGGGLLADSAKYPDCRGPLVRKIEHLPGPSGTTSDGTGVFSNRITWNLKPNIGVIATAPLEPLAAGADTDFMTGPHGGNLDCAEVCKGNKIMLPVAHDGALLYVGDVQATQASEFCGTADETRAEVTLSCKVLPNRGLPRDEFILNSRTPHPRIETPDEIIQLSCFRPIDDALREAHRWLLEWLIEDYGFSPVEAYLQFSVNPDVKMHVYRFVTWGRYEHTVGVSIPKKYLV